MLAVADFWALPNDGGDGRGDDWRDCVMHTDNNKQQQCRWQPVGGGV
jgi:hypothetical protein